MNYYIVAVTIVIHCQHRNLGEHRVGRGRVGREKSGKASQRR